MEIPPVTLQKVAFQVVIQVIIQMMILLEIWENHLNPLVLQPLMTKPMCYSDLSKQ
jgi:hypothetical protein